MSISTEIKLYNASKKDNSDKVGIIALALVLIVAFIYYLCLNWLIIMSANLASLIIS